MFCLKPCVTLAYLEAWYMQNLRNYQNPIIWCGIFLIKPDIFRALIYSEPWHILKAWYIRNPAKYVQWRILLRTLKYSLFRLLLHLKSWHIQHSKHSKYWESLKYSLHRTMCNLGIFTTIACSSPQKAVKHVWQGVFYTTLCNTGIFRAQGIFKTLSNIYDRKLYSQTFVTLAYLEKWHIQNTTEHLSQNILFKTFCNPDIFRTLVYSPIKAYSESCRISKM